MENKVKQTALQWLNDELNKKYGIELSADSEVFNKALQMEEFQIDRAFDDGYCNGKDNPDNFNDQYYTDTYGE